MFSLLGRLPIALRRGTILLTSRVMIWLIHYEMGMVFSHRDGEISLRSSRLRFSLDFMDCTSGYPALIATGLGITSAICFCHHTSLDSLLLRIFAGFVSCVISY